MKSDIEVIENDVHRNHGALILAPTLSIPHL